MISGRKIVITEKEYNEYSEKTPAEINEFIESKIPQYIICGYGFYGGTLLKDGTSYYVKYLCGDSCD